MGASNVIIFCITMSVFVHCRASYAVVFSAGQTDYAVLAAAPSSSALYGFAVASSPNIMPIVNVTLTAPNGSVVATSIAASESAGSGNTCDASCYDAGYLSSVGTSSCCSAPSCPMGCAIGTAVSSLAACKAQCSSAASSSDCSFTVAGTGLVLQMCASCIHGCPGALDCDAGCSLYFAANTTRAWKALLPPQAPGGDYTVTAHCSNCVAGAVPVRSLLHVTFGSVFYCSGQSNMALGMLYTFQYSDVVAEIKAGNHSDIRFFQLGGMEAQNAALSPMYATTALTYPAWPWQNLSAALAAQNADSDSFQGFGSVPATCFYFVYSLKKAGAPGPFGFISNAVGGTTIATWADSSVLASCPNSTYSSTTAAPVALFNGMVAPLINTTFTAMIWYQGENDVGGVMGNSAVGYGYGCALPKLISRYRELWSVVPGTTDPLVPFGVVSLAAGTSEGYGEHMSGMRWSQTGNYGVVPNPAMPACFLAQTYDLGDPWEMYSADDQNCSLAGVDTGQFDPSCVQPWTNLSSWDPVVVALAPAIRNDSTPSYQGALHPRTKPPVGHRLAQAYTNVFLGGSAPYTGPTIIGCAYDAAAGTITVAYNVSLLRGESVLVQPFDAKASNWGVSDSLTFMVCFSATGGAECLSQDDRHLSFWAPASAAAGRDGTSAVLTVPPSPIAGGVVSTLRYGWTLSTEGDTCCPQLNVTLGYEVCTPGNCPIKTSRTFLPGNPFYANITSLGQCACLYPQLCDAPNVSSSSVTTSLTHSASATSSGTATQAASPSQSGTPSRTPSPSQAFSVTQSASHSSTQISTYSSTQTLSITASPSKTLAFSLSRSSSQDITLSYPTPSYTRSTFVNGSQTPSITACASNCSTPGVAKADSGSSSAQQTIDVTGLPFQVGLGVGLALVIAGAVAALLFIRHKQQSRRSRAALSSSPSIQTPQVVHTHGLEIFQALRRQRIAPSSEAPSPLAEDTA